MRRLVPCSLAALAALAACSQPQPASPVVRAEARPAQPSQPAQPAHPSQPAQGGTQVAQAPAPAEHHGDPHGTAAPQAPAQPVVPGGTRRFGEPLAASASRVTLEQVVRTHAQLGDRTVRVDGNIVAVCQHMGCWMEIRDGETQAHVRMHGHSFFLPRDVNGKRAAMVGTIVAAHPPTECDESAQQATGRVAQVEFDATGVEVYD